MIFASAAVSSLLICASFVQAAPNRPRYGVVDPYYAPCDSVDWFYDPESECQPSEPTVTTTSPSETATATSTATNGLNKRTDYGPNGIYGVNGAYGINGPYGPDSAASPAPEVSPISPISPVVPPVNPVVPPITSVVPPVVNAPPMGIMIGIPCYTAPRFCVKCRDPHPLNCPENTYWCGVDGSLCPPEPPLPGLPPSVARRSLNTRRSSDNPVVMYWKEYKITGKDNDKMYDCVLPMNSRWPLLNDVTCPQLIDVSNPRPECFEVDKKADDQFKSCAKSTKIDLNKYKQ